MSSPTLPQRQEIDATFQLGLTRLEAAGENQSTLGQALLSFHGALEDYIRFFLATNSAVPAETREVVRDRGKTQWRDLVMFAQRYHVINANDKNIILSMNRKRQEIAHGKACQIHKREIEFYAGLVRSVINYTEPTANYDADYMQTLELVRSVKTYPDPTVRASPARSTPPSRPSVTPRSSPSERPTQRSAASGYAIAIGVASTILIVLVIGVVLLYTQSLTPRTAPSSVAVATTAMPDCVIKGNISVSTGNKLYHLPGMENYDSTEIDLEKGERWFCTEAEALAQGWTRATK
ncbi:MAG: hypothetical protein WCP31_12005 [Chloroflexales bacterium]